MNNEKAQNQGLTYNFELFIFLLHKNRQLTPDKQEISTKGRLNNQCPFVSKNDTLLSGVPHD
jgi:hypothetical protein